MSTSGQQIERLEKGQRRLTQDWIERAAVALGVGAIDIIGGESGDTPDLPPTLSASARDDVVEVPALDLSHSMGPGTEVDDYIEVELVRFDLGFLRQITRTAPERLRLARGVGDSMFPTLLTNDSVLIDTTQRTLNLTDRVYAISLYGGAAIKRLRPVGDGRIRVISDNPIVDDQEVNAEDVVIAGRVIWFARDL
jgi:phage repressor protein C with HTH and peptisase S24 domain